jgi:hypothetical protein
MALLHAQLLDERVELVFAPLVDDALDRGLLELHARGVVVTSAGNEHVLRAAVL